MNAPAVTRRAFLGTLTGGAALAAATRVFPQTAAAAPTPPAAPHTGPAAVHVFAKPFQALDYAATAELIASAGFRGIDFTARPGGHIHPDRAAADLPRAVVAARAAGLRVDTITTAVTSATPETRRFLSVVRDAGIRVYRLGNFAYDRALGPWQTLQRLKPQLAALAALNEELGLHGAIQNHTGAWRVGAAGWDLHELIRDLDPRWLGCQYDIRHATAVNGTSWVATLDLLAPWIRSLVLKDFRWLQRPGEQVVENVPLGTGICDLAAFLRRVDQLALPAVWSLHLEFPPFEPAAANIDDDLHGKQLEGLRREHATLQSLLASTRAAST